MFGFLLLRGDKLHPEAFMEEKNEAMMVREPWLEIINKQGNQNPRMLTIIKPSVRLTQSDNVRARFNSSNRHSLRYYRVFLDKFFTNTIKPHYPLAYVQNDNAIPIQSAP